MASGPYRIPRIDFHAVSVVTTTTPVGAYRGAGLPEARGCSSGPWTCWRPSSASIPRRSGGAISSPPSISLPTRPAPTTTAGTRAGPSISRFAWPVRRTAPGTGRTHRPRGNVPARHRHLQLRGGHGLGKRVRVGGRRRPGDVHRADRDQLRGRGTRPHGRRSWPTPWASRSTRSRSGIRTRCSFRAAREQWDRGPSRWAARPCCGPRWPCWTRPCGFAAHLLETSESDTRRLDGRIGVGGAPELSFSWASSPPPPQTPLASRPVWSRGCGRRTTSRWRIRPIRSVPTSRWWRWTPRRER